MSHSASIEQLNGNNNASCSEEDDGTSVYFKNARNALKQSTTSILSFFERKNTLARRLRTNMNKRRHRASNRRSTNSRNHLDTKRLGNLISAFKEAAGADKMGKELTLRLAKYRNGSRLNCNTGGSKIGKLVVLTKTLMGLDEESKNRMNRSKEKYVSVLTFLKDAVKRKMSAPTMFEKDGTGGQEEFECGKDESTSIEIDEEINKTCEETHKHSRKKVANEELNFNSNFTKDHHESVVGGQKNIEILYNIHQDDVASNNSNRQYGVVKRIVKTIEGDKIKREPNKMNTKKPSMKVVPSWTANSWTPRGMLFTHSETNVRKTIQEIAKHGVVNVAGKNKTKKILESTTYGASSPCDSLKRKQNHQLLRGKPTDMNLEESKKHIVSSSLTSITDDQEQDCSKHSEKKNVGVPNYLKGDELQRQNAVVRQSKYSKDWASEVTNSQQKRKDAKDAYENDKGPRRQSGAAEKKTEIEKSEKPMTPNAQDWYTEKKNNVTSVVKAWKDKVEEGIDNRSLPKLLKIKSKEKKVHKKVCKSTSKLKLGKFKPSDHAEVEELIDNISLQHLPRTMRLESQYAKPKSRSSVGIKRRGDKEGIKKGKPVDDGLKTFSVSQVLEKKVIRVKGNKKLMKDNIELGSLQGDPNVAVLQNPKPNKHLEAQKSKAPHNYETMAASAENISNLPKLLKKIPLKTYKNSKDPGEHEVHKNEVEVDKQPLRQLLQKKKPRENKNKTRMDTKITRLTNSPESKTLVYNPGSVTFEKLEASQFGGKKSSSQEQRLNATGPLKKVSSLSINRDVLSVKDKVLQWQIINGETASVKKQTSKDNIPEAKLEKVVFYQNGGPAIRRRLKKHSSSALKSENLAYKDDVKNIQYARQSTTPERSFSSEEEDVHALSDSEKSKPTDKTSKTRFQEIVNTGDNKGNDKKLSNIVPKPTKRISETDKQIGKISSRKSSRVYQKPVRISRSGERSKRHLVKSPTRTHVKDSVECNKNIVFSKAEKSNLIRRDLKTSKILKGIKNENTGQGPLTTKTKNYKSDKTCFSETEKKKKTGASNKGNVKKKSRRHKSDTAKRKHPENWNMAKNLFGKPSTVKRTDSSKVLVERAKETSCRQQIDNTQKPPKGIIKLSIPQTEEESRILKIKQSAAPSKVSVTTRGGTSAIQKDKHTPQTKSEKKPTRRSRKSPGKPALEKFALPKSKKGQEETKPKKLSTLKKCRKIFTKTEKECLSQQTQWRNLKSSLKLKPLMSQASRTENRSPKSPIKATPVELPVYNNKKKDNRDRKVSKNKAYNVQRSKSFKNNSVISTEQVSRSPSEMLSTTNDTIASKKHRKYSVGLANVKRILRTVFRSSDKINRGSTVTFDACSGDSRIPFQRNLAKGAQQHDIESVRENTNLGKSSACKNKQERNDKTCKGAVKPNAKPSSKKLVIKSDVVISTQKNVSKRSDLRKSKRRYSESDNGLTKAQRQHDTVNQRYSISERNKNESLPEIKKTSGMSMQTVRSTTFNSENTNTSASDTSQMESDNCASKVSDKSDRLHRKKTIPKHHETPNRRDNNKMGRRGKGGLLKKFRAKAFGSVGKRKQRKPTKKKVTWEPRSTAVKIAKDELYTKPTDSVRTIKKQKKSKLKKAHNTKRKPKSKEQNDPGKSTTVQPSPSKSMEKEKIPDERHLDTSTVQPPPREIMKKEEIRDERHLNKKSKPHKRKSKEKRKTSNSTKQKDFKTAVVKIETSEGERTRGACRCAGTCRVYRNERKGVETKHDVTHGNTNPICKEEKDVTEKKDVPIDEKKSLSGNVLKKVKKFTNLFTGSSSSVSVASQTVLSRKLRNSSSAISLFDRLERRVQLRPSGDQIKQRRGRRLKTNGADEFSGRVASPLKTSRSGMTIYDRQHRRLVGSRSSPTLMQHWFSPHNTFKPPERASLAKPSKSSFRRAIAVFNGKETATPWRPRRLSGKIEARRRTPPPRSLSPKNVSTSKKIKHGDGVKRTGGTPSKVMIPKAWSSKSSSSVSRPRRMSGKVEPRKRMPSPRFSPPRRKSPSIASSKSGKIMSSSFRFRRLLRFPGIPAPSVKRGKVKKKIYHKDRHYSLPHTKFKTLYENQDQNFIVKSEVDGKVDELKDKVEEVSTTVNKVSDALDEGALNKEYDDTELMEEMDMVNNKLNLLADSLAIITEKLDQPVEPVKEEDDNPYATPAWQQYFAYMYGYNAASQANYGELTNYCNTLSTYQKLTCPNTKKRKKPHPGFCMCELCLAFKKGPSCPIGCKCEKCTREWPRSAGTSICPPGCTCLRCTAVGASCPPGCTCIRCTSLGFCYPCPQGCTCARCVMRTDYCNPVKYPKQPWKVTGLPFVAQSGQGDRQPTQSKSQKETPGSELNKLASDTGSTVTTTMSTSSGGSLTITSEDDATTTTVAPSSSEANANTSSTSNPDDDYSSTNYTSVGETSSN